VDNFVDRPAATPLQARKIKGLAGLPAKTAPQEIVMNQALSAAIGFVAIAGFQVTPGHGFCA
jgi:hypothetical protein